METKTPEQAKEEYIRQYIYGPVGKHTWREELRGFAVDHTQAADRGPLSPTLTSKLPPISVSSQEAVLVFFIQPPHFKFKLGCNVLISGCQIIGLWCGLKSVKIIFSFTISGIFFVPFIEKERFRMATNRSMSAKIPFVVAFSNTNVG